jgi:hypothetical protein
VDLKVHASYVQLRSENSGFCSTSKGGAKPTFAGELAG